MVGTSGARLDVTGFSAPTFNTASQSPPHRPPRRPVMCGIIGYLGDREATPILMDGLKRLEYRGYDSAGVAVLEPGAPTPSVIKSESRVDELIAKLRDRMPRGSLGIGHTRWATHGKPTLTNAHPHVD